MTSWHRGAGEGSVCQFPSVPLPPEAVLCGSLEHRQHCHTTGVQSMLADQYMSLREKQFPRRDFPASLLRTQFWNPLGPAQSTLPCQRRQASHLPCLCRQYTSAQVLWVSEDSREQISVSLREGPPEAAGWGTQEPTVIIVVNPVLFF